MFVPLIALVLVVGLVIFYLVTDTKKKDIGNPPGSLLSTGAFCRFFLSNHP